MKGKIIITWSEIPVYWSPKNKTFPGTGTSLRCTVSIYLFMIRIFFLFLPTFAHAGELYS